jgi:hypothetical protein
MALMSRYAFDLFLSEEAWAVHDNDPRIRTVSRTERHGVGTALFMVTQ